MGGYALTPQENGAGAASSPLSGCGLLTHRQFPCATDTLPGAEDDVEHVCDYPAIGAAFGPDSPR